MSTALRDYQSTALEVLREGIRKGVRRQLLVLSTGAGKGTLLAFMQAGAAQRDLDVLFMVARRQLVHEFSHRLSSQFGVKHSVVMAGVKPTPGMRASVSSIDTLFSMLKRGVALPPAKLIIVDEADEAISRRFLDVLAQYPEASVIGDTATPIRADGKGLGQYFDVMHAPIRMRELIDQGYLSDFDAIGFRPALSADELARAASSDKAAEDVYAALSDAAKDKRIGNVVETWALFGGHRRTIGFAMSIDDSRAICARFNAERVGGAPLTRAEHVDNTTPWPERQAVIGRLKSGETEVLCNVRILGRGVDIPCAEVCAFWSPDGSLAGYLQKAGRVLRTCPGKTEALYLDHVGNIDRHELPDYPHRWSLADGVLRPEGTGLPALTRCGSCFTEYLSRKDRCPLCGTAPAKPPVQQALIEEVQAVRVVDLKARAPKADKVPMPAAERRQRSLDGAVRKALRNGWKLRAAGKIYAGIFGTMPTDAALEEAAARVRNE